MCLISSVIMLPHQHSMCLYSSVIMLPLCRLIYGLSCTTMNFFQPMGIHLGEYLYVNSNLMSPTRWGGARPTQNYRIKFHIVFCLFCHSLKPLLDWTVIDCVVVLTEFLWGDSETLALLSLCAREVPNRRASYTGSTLLPQAGERHQRREAHVSQISQTRTI